jgi:hypothetical protein
MSRKQRPGSGEKASRSRALLAWQQITRQERIVHGVLASAVLAAHVGYVVQPVHSSRAE